MQIQFLTKGELKTIPNIKPGKLIKLIGKNGVGKSMAAIFLELACGNYRFKNENHFKEIKNRLKECEINLKSNSDNIEILLTPGTWLYNNEEFKIEENSIGFYKFNNQKVDINHFKEIISVKVIRGDENLETQINLVTNMFIELVDKYSNENSKFIENLKIYQKYFENKRSIDLINQYKEKQKDYSDIEKQINQVQKNLEETSNSLIITKQKVEIIEKILIWDENNPITIKHEIEGIEYDIEKYDKLYEENLINLKQTQEKLNNIEETKKSQIQDYIVDKNKFSKKKGSIIQKISKKFPNEINEILKAKNLDLIEDLEIKKKELLEKIQRKYDTEVEGKAKYLTNLMNKMKLIQEILDECIADGLGDQIIIEDYYHEDLIKLSIEVLNQFFNNRILVLESRPEHIALMEKIEELSADVRKKVSLLNHIKEWKNIMKKEEHLNKTKQMITDNNLDQFLEPELIKQYLDNQDNLLNEIPQIKMKLNDLNARFEILNQKYHLTDNLEKKQELFKKLKGLFEILPTDYDNEYNEINRNIKILEKKRDGIEYSLNNLNTRLTKIQKEINQIKNSIMKIAKKYNYDNFIDWIRYVTNHSKRIHKLINDYLIPLSDYINSIKKTFYLIKENKSIIKGKYISLISDIYNQFFLNTYNKPSFFKYVFRGYKNIKRFDIINKNIIFTKEDGSDDNRSLSDFSSGEKAYAFIRAMISLIDKKAKYKILFIDEANALLDYIRASDLQDFQVNLINNNDLNKIINIFPIHESPEQLSDIYRDEFLQNGYYQEIVKQ